ncbi:hypothetical protein IJ425_06995 [bacterium]|nr:hypothetical protein [bacterium]
MNRVAIFAHYDTNCKIEDYVIYYLKELQKISTEIIFVSDCNLPSEETNKLKDITNHIIAKRHGEYDFGSYKYGYIFAKEKNLITLANELIFANDSCFGPLISFNQIWKKMEEKECDFWGITKNNIDVDYHIQSYFLVFKENVFKTEIFDNFINTISKEENKNKIIEKYEIGLSKLLIKNDFKPETYCNYKIARNITQDLFYNDSTPFLKKWEILTLYPTLVNIIIKKIFKRIDSNYKIDYITSFFKKRKTTKFAKNLKIIRRIIIEIKTNKKTINILGKTIKYG